MGENRFQIRHGSKAPKKGDLLPYEFGYDKTNEKLYMGQEEENPLFVGPVTLKTLGIEDEIAWLEDATVEVQEQLDGEKTTFKVLSIKNGGTGAATAEGAVINLKNELLNFIYPVGSIYMSIDSTNPSTLFGGTWEQLKDRFLLAAGDVYANETTGGEASHTLTIEEMPTHDHDVRTTRSESYPAYWHTNHTGNTNSSSGWSYLSTAGSDNGGVGTLYVEEVGGGAAHNNMPPYLAVNMWKRIA